MKKKYIVTIMVVILIAALFIFFYPQSEKPQSDLAKTGSDMGNRAPDFSLQNLNEKEIKLSDYQGEKVFINFWASWCPPCKAEMPDLQRLNENYQDQIVILTINVGESKAAAINFMMMHNFSFPVLLDQDKAAAQDYLVRGIPSSYFIDQNGIIINKTVGAIKKCSN